MITAVDYDVWDCGIGERVVGKYVKVSCGVETKRAGANGTSLVSVLCYLYIRTTRYIAGVC